MTTNQLHDWAQHLASRGWAVFPIVPGAQRPPAIRDWESRATTDPERIKSCWYGRGFNIGVATGPSGLVVVDLDPAKTPGAPDGAAGLAALAAARNVTLPATWTVSTPRGGCHLYFTCPPGVRLRNTESRLAPAIDTRAATYPPPRRGLRARRRHRPARAPGLVGPGPHRTAVRIDLSAG